eukprot:1551768-Rhodomonas_salina.1
MADLAVLLRARAVCINAASSLQKLRGTTRAHLKNVLGVVVAFGQSVATRGTQLHAVECFRVEPTAPCAFGQLASAPADGFGRTVVERLVAAEMAFQTVQTLHATRVQEFPPFAALKAVRKLRAALWRGLPLTRALELPVSTGTVMIFFTRPGYSDTDPQRDTDIDPQTEAEAETDIHRNTDRSRQSTHRHRQTDSDTETETETETETCTPAGVPESAGAVARRQHGPEGRVYWRAPRAEPVPSVNVHAMLQMHVVEKRCDIPPHPSCHCFDRDDDAPLLQTPRRVRHKCQSRGHWGFAGTWQAEVDDERVCVKHGNTPESVALEDKNLVCKRQCARLQPKDLVVRQIQQPESLLVIEDLRFDRADVVVREVYLQEQVSELIEHIACQVFYPVFSEVQHFQIGRPIKRPNSQRCNVCSLQFEDSQGAQTPKCVGRQIPNAVAME